MPAPFTYQYDPLGTNVANRITAELHAVSPPASLDNANFIVPLAAPFFQSSLRVRTGPNPNSPLLNEGTDYILTHKFVEASQSLGLQVYGSIMFTDRAYAGNVWVTYQTLGGPYTLNDVGIVTTLTRSLYNIRLVFWTQITPLPAAFPPVQHPHDTADLTGMAEILAVLEQIKLAIISGGANLNSLSATLQQHLTGNGSHTKDQVGLSQLMNYRLATQEDVELLRTNCYMNARMVHYAINRFNLGGNQVIDADTIDKGISRFGTLLETLAGTLDNVAVTPAGLAYVIDQLIDSIVLSQQIRVNALYLTADANENPATSLGYGTWTRIAKGRYLKGYDPDAGTVIPPLTPVGAADIEITRANLPAEGINVDIAIRVGGGGDPGDPGALDRNDIPNGTKPFQTENLGDGVPLPIDPLGTVICVWMRTS